MKSALNKNDSIEVIDKHNGLWAQIRIREATGKASVLLTPDELEEHARECVVLAAKMKERR